jgi:anti-anti-sigma regulatory factor
MPIDRTTAVDALHLDAVLTLDVDLGVAVIDLTRVSFVDAYALTGLACFIASAARGGLPVRLVLPEHPDVRSWLSRMHLGDVIDTFEVDVGGGLPRVAERDRRDTLIELQRFDDSHGSDRLATFIWERLQAAPTVRS